MPGPHDQERQVGLTGDMQVNQAMAGDTPPLPPPKVPTLSGSHIPKEMSGKRTWASE